MNTILFAVLAGLSWGVGEIFTKGALNSREIGPLGTVLVRALVTLPLALAAFALAHGVFKTEPQAWWRMSGEGAMSGGTWLKLLLGSGLLAGFAGVFFFYLGLAQPGGDISVLRPIAFALAPATAVLLGWWLLGEPMTLRKGLAVVLILAGIVMLAGEGKRAGEKASGDRRDGATLAAVPPE
ncbi:MAG: EamA family transporter [Phycisphaerales bacterium]